MRIKLSQEHSTLPLAEIRALLEAEFPASKYSFSVCGNDVHLSDEFSAEMLKKRLAYALEINGIELEQGFSQRVGGKRPFSHPVTLDPKLARCMVNLSRVKRGQTLLDPFCGTGGILIEAGLMGCKPIGVDISKEMIQGCGKNLEYYNVFGAKLIQADFFETDIETDAIATDPPYGKSTSLKEPLEEFYEKVLGKISGMSHEYSCVAAPSEIDLKTLATNIGFKVVEEHVYYLNKDVSKRIVVVRKQL